MKKTLLINMLVSLCASVGMAYPVLDLEVKSPSSQDNGNLIREFTVKSSLDFEIPANGEILEYSLGVNDFKLVARLRIDNSSADNVVEELRVVVSEKWAEENDFYLSSRKTIKFKSDMGKFAFPMVIAEPILESAAQSLDKNCLGNQLAIETLKKNNVQYYVFTGLPCYKDGEFLVDGTAYDISASKIDLVLADGSIDAEKYLNFNAEADVDPMAALLANLNF